MAALTIPANWQRRDTRNQNARPKSAVISAIVLHADASNRVDSTLDWCRRPESKVSYHLLIGRTGNVFMLVHPEQRAWHAGRSALDGVVECNDYSVGVCLSNNNTGEAYPAAQIYEAVKTCALLCRTYDIPAERIVTHASVATPAGRKTDPKGLDVETFRLQVLNMLREKRPPLR